MEDEQEINPVIQDILDRLIRLETKMENLEGVDQN